MNIQFVKQSVEPWGSCPSDETEMLKWIERAGRVAYKSEDKITEDSALGFVQKMIKSGHGSVLEHSNITLFEQSYNPRLCYVVFGPRSAFHSFTRRNENSYVSGNLRSWIETLDYFQANNSTEYDWYYGYLNYRFPLLFVDPKRTNLQLFLLDEHDQIQKLILQESDLPIFTFKIICDRGISHEIVRHRINMSYTQESTRYVNSDKRGFVFVDPEFEDESSRDVIKNLCEYSSMYYLDLLNLGHKPQIARDVLPNLLKTEIVASGRWSAWKHFILLRNSPAAHPRIQRIARDIERYFMEIGVI